MRPRAQRNGFLVKPVGDQVVVFDQSRRCLHVLSRTTAVVWRHCDGRHTVSELIDIVGGELGAPVDENVITLALAQLDEARLLEERLAPPSREDKVSRRELLHMAGALAAGIILPTITSCGVPTDPAAPGTAASASISTSDLTTTTSTTATTPLITTTTSTTPLVTTTTSTTTTTTSTTTTTPAPKKVAVCHQGRTIMVDQEAVEAHLAHGDTLGRCP